MNSVLDLLQALVRIPSVNPDGDPDVSPEGERKMAEFVGTFLEPLGFRVTLEDCELGRPNIIARAPGNNARPRILLGPHLDTVSIKGMTIDPFAADISDGKVWGRGTSDTKGPMAAMLWGLKENSHCLADLPVAVDFVGFAGEESRQPGSRHFAKEYGSEYEFAIVGEPTSMEAVFCTKGCLWATIESKGQATHASQPHLGENAILKLNAALAALMSDFLPVIQENHHAVLNSPTLNIGKISGGMRPNIVPDHAEAIIDIRTVPEMVSTQSAETLLTEFLKDLDVSLQSASEFPPMEMAKDQPWLSRLREIHPELKLAGAPWFSDAAHLSAAGLPSICLGPGSIDQAHTADEFIKISDLEAGAAWFSKLIAEL